MKRTRYSRVVGVVIALIAVFGLNLIFTPRSTAETASGLSWSDPIEPSIKQQQTLTLDEYLQLTGQTNFPCKPETVYRGVPSANFNLHPSVDAPLSGCTIAGMSGKYDFSNQAVIPYGSKRNQVLADPSVSRTFYFGVQGTNKIAVLSNAYQFFYGGTPTLHIANDWTSTFANFSADQAGNVTRSRSQPYDFVLKDRAGNPVEVRPNGVSFSANGRWLHAGVTNVSQVVVDLQTHEVIPFAPFTGMDYALYSKVSNDGRYVALSRPYGGLKIYDLTKCQPASGEFTSRDCEHRDVFENLRTYLSTNDLRVRNLDFVGADNALDVTVDFQNADGAWAYGVYRMYLPNTTPDKYLALGDSFSSGEGAYDYRSPTDFYIDDTNYNLCHQSRNSYPYLIQQSLKFDWFNSVACSGARVKDLSSQDSLEYLKQSSQAKTSQKNDDQIKNVLENITPGYVPQIKFNDSYSPSIATVSIGGNDFGFGKIIEKCVIGGGDNDVLCYFGRDEREKLANSIEDKIPELAVLLHHLKSSLSGSNPKLYVIGYPEIIKPNGVCGLNVMMQSTETVFTESLTQFINDALKTAAIRAGASFVDVSKAFVKDDEDYRLCSNVNQFAVNGLVLKGDSSKKPDRIAHAESYHPNQLGQSLLAAVVLKATNNFTSQSATADTSAVMPESSRIKLVGDAEVRYSNYDIKLVEDLSPDTIFKEERLNINFHLSPGATPPSASSDIRAEIHSDPIQLGSLQFSNQAVDGSITIPSTIMPGFHELHVIYTNIEGTTVDLYKHVYIANSKNDFDGDGINNSSDICSMTVQSGVDQDEDGIDDACDGEYVRLARQPSENMTAVGRTQTPQKTSDANTFSATVRDTETVLSAQTYKSGPVFVFGDSATDLNQLDTAVTTPAARDQTNAKDELQYLLFLAGTVSILCVCLIWYLRKHG